MKVIPPLTITDAMVTSSTAAEPAAGETAWVSGTTYALGDVVIRTTTHRKYERLIAGAGTTPPESDALNWLDVGPTNKWAMFDLLRNTATTVTGGPLTVTITPGQRVSAIALMGCVASAVTVTVVAGGQETVPTFTQSLIRRTTRGWFDYFFKPFRRQPSVVLFDLPPFSGAAVTVQLETTEGVATCGAMVIGQGEFLGSTQYQANSEALNFSTVTRDEFGNATLVPRRTVPKTSQTLFSTKESVNNLREIRSQLNAVPAVWSGADDVTDDGYFEALLILGIYKEFSINMDFPTHARVSLELEEI